MLSAVPSLWGPSLEFYSRESPANLVASEVSAASHVVEFEFVVPFLPGSEETVSSHEQIPSIDESLFDFLEIPDLEEVGIDGESCSIPTASLLRDFLMDEIPPLEDVTDEVHNQPWTLEESGAAEQVIDGIEIEQVSPSGVEVATHNVLFEEEVVIEDQISPFREHRDTLTPPVDHFRSDSPTSSCYSDGNYLEPAEKRRRVSQISMSSYCSSAGDSQYSPISSDSDADSRRGGRKSRFSPEDRKERKKAQNRSAAERYRLKRKQQEETIGGEEQQLIEANTELRTEVTKLEAEVSCLKRLMREMLQAKGVAIPGSPPQKKKNVSFK